MIKKFCLMIMVSLVLLVGCKTEKEAAIAPQAETPTAVAGQGVDAGAAFITEEELGIRDWDLYTEDGDFEFLTNYSNAAPGTATRVDRSFENAPPLIPHMVTGFVPIKSSNNICLTCHMPAVAVALKSTAIPASHFTNFRPEIKKEANGLYAVQAKEGEVVANDMKGQLNQARFNCTQCHVPQSQITVDLENIFSPDFRNELLKNQSNLLDVVKEGIDN
ncbi:MAG: nitrate reductase [Bacteroidetes bacterium]|nr:nitrate reductase [Bacteroidota bacterium]